MGHLFVAQGDLTRLACDALLIPCDSKLRVNKAWAPILPAGLPRFGYSLLQLHGEVNSARVLNLPHSRKRLVQAFIAVDIWAEPAEVVDRMWTALQSVSNGLGHADGRTTPLIGVPLVGTGFGGLEHHRGKVIKELLARHRSSSLSADVALVLLDSRDFVAVQRRRDAAADWPELDTGLLGKADSLGRYAGRKQLSLFLGAGVSRPAGLPDWWGLLDHLADAAKVARPAHRGRAENAATPIVKALGDDRYLREMKRRLHTSKHAVGHALLAGLGVDRMVTTNFDVCMELALKTAVDKDFRVLARQLADGGMPWLLKLNGDIKRPESLTLTSEDFKRHKVESAALRGVVQSLMLTSHLLFVGFSFRDKSFLELAQAVSRVRRVANDSAGTLAGTALALTKTDVAHMGGQDLLMIPMLDKGSDLEAARKLEIFLDRLGWAAATHSDRAAEYLLDDRYESGLSDPDRALREILNTVEGASGKAKLSAGWPRVAACLIELGADPERIMNRP